VVAALESDDHFGSAKHGESCLPTFPQLVPTTTAGAIKMHNCVLDISLAIEIALHEVFSVEVTFFAKVL
jgi:hypothetical protein